MTINILTIDFDHNYEQDYFGKVDFYDNLCLI